MKTFAKFLMVGAVAVVAIAVSAAPSGRGKRHNEEDAGAFPAGCLRARRPCAGLPHPLQEGRSTVYICGGDAKWVAAPHAQAA